MAAIEIRNLSKEYRRRHLGKLYRNRGIEDISFSVKKGEIFGLLGLNGSGKTTTIKLILGLLTPTGGEVFVSGKKVPSNEVLRTIGYLPEVPYFYRYLTGKEILHLYAGLSGVDNQDIRVQEVIDMVGLDSVKNRPLGSYSKGMLQRIGLAQSLLHDPEILIYDEPVSGLDPLAISQMRNLIVRLKEQGKTVFLSSHLISEVEKVCDRVGILAQGKLVRVMSHSEWSSSEGSLEKIFVADVADSAEVGRITV